ncbi:MAG: 2Fe-2S iron-sulfur cluster-binding protein [[Clostridium] scindens]
MCVVEVKGARNLVAACVHPINEGMEVWTNTPRADRIQKEDPAAASFQSMTENAFPA